MENHHLKHPPCESHPNGRPVSVCPGCGKTVCSECIKLYGYFCSEACREAARAAEPEEEATEGRVDYVAAQQQYDRIAKILFRRIPPALAALIALVVLIRWVDSTGEEQWRVTLEQSFGIAQMLEVDDTVFVLDGDGTLTAMDTKTGEARWSRPGENLEPPVVHMEEALIMAGSGSLLSLNIQDGTVRWEHEMDEGVYNVRWKADPEGIVAGATSYTSSDEDDESWTMNSNVRLLDSTSGDVRWQRALDSQTVHEVGFFDGKPWCVTSESHLEESSAFQLESLNPADGRRVWGIRAIGDETPSVLVTHDRMVVVLTDEVIGIGEDGTKLWEEPLEQNATLSTQVQNQVVLCIDGEELRSLDIDSGKQHWSIKVTGWIEDVSVGAGMLYASVAGWEKDGEAPQSPLESMPDGPEKQLLNELFFSEDEMEEGVDARMFAEVDRVAVYDLQKGRLKWDDRMDNGTVTPGTNGCYMRHYIIGMGSLMGDDISGRLIARAASDGDVLWRYKSDAELTSLVEGDQLLYLESTKILPEALSKYGGGRPPEISVVAIRKRGFLHRLTHW